MSKRYDAYMDWLVLAFVTVLVILSAGFMVAMLWHLFTMI